MPIRKLTLTTRHARHIDIKQEMLDGRILPLVAGPPGSQGKITATAFSIPSSRNTLFRIVITWTDGSRNSTHYNTKQSHLRKTIATPAGVVASSSSPSSSTSSSSQPAVLQGQLQALLARTVGSPTTISPTLTTHSFTQHESYRPSGPAISTGPAWSMLFPDIQPTPAPISLSGMQAIRHHRNALGLQAIRRLKNPRQARTALVQLKLLRPALRRLDWATRRPIGSPKTWKQQHTAMHASSPVSPAIVETFSDSVSLNHLVNQLQPAERAVLDSLMQFYGVVEPHRDLIEMAPLLLAHVRDRPRSAALDSLRSYIASWPVDQPADIEGFANAVLDGASAAGVLAVEPAIEIPEEYLFEGTKALGDEEPLVEVPIEGGPMALEMGELDEELEEPSLLKDPKMIGGALLAAAVAGGLWYKKSQQQGALNYFDNDWDY